MRNDAKCASLLKLIELVKKSFNLIKIEKEKPHWLYCLISHSFACFVELVIRPYFCLAKSLTDNLAMGQIELRREKVVISFSG